MHQIGYSLIDETGAEIRFWGDALNQCAGLPNSIRLPNGDDIHAISAPGTFQQWRLVPRFAASGGDGAASFDGTKVIVNVPITGRMVVVERERRLGLGFDYDFGDVRGVHRIGTTADDMTGWQDVTTASQAAIALGYGDSKINIVTDTGPVTVTALEWQKILVAATSARQPIWAASFRLQQMSPIPADYADDKNWQ